MTGFLPLGAAGVRERYAVLPEGACAGPHSLESLIEVDTLLEEYADALWPAFDAMVQRRPLEPHYPWTWREQVCSLVLSSISLMCLRKA